MPEYRVYELDDSGQPSGPPSIGVWKDDLEAEMNARTLLGDHALEIWCGDRKVAALEPD